jgi:hypothetical protein
VDIRTRDEEAIVDTKTIQKVTQWVQRRFGDRTSAVTSAELVRAAGESGLPQEVQNVLEGLPQEAWPVEELVPTVHDALMVQIGGSTERALP